MAFRHRILRIYLFMIYIVAVAQLLEALLWKPLKVAVSIPDGVID
jgi:hypothetical protein